MVVFSIWHWLIVLYLAAMALLLVAWPAARILRRTGLTRWWTLLVFIPPLNLILIWIVAYRRWPAMDAVPEPRARQRSTLPLDPFGMAGKRRR